MDLENPEDINSLIMKEIKNVTNLKENAEKKANIMKILHIVFSILIISFGSIIGALSLNDNKNSKYILYLLSILGFMVALMEGISSTFMFGKKSILLKNKSLELKDIIFYLNNLLSSTRYTEIEKIKKLDKKRSLVNIIDSNIFGIGSSELTYTPKTYASDSIKNKPI